MKAKTDSGPTEANSEMPDYIENLFTLMQLVSTPDTFEHFQSAFNNCNIRYGDFKKQLAEDMVSFVNPIRTQAQDLCNDHALMQKIMKMGAEKARASAVETIKLTREAIGIRYHD